MQVKSTKMGQWPPSPSVEDEEKALANEHFIDATLESSKSDDQPAPCRGSIDQYPVIIDSPVQERVQEPDSSRASKTVAHDQAVGDGGSSDDSAGPPTPPPLVRKEEKRPRQSPPVRSDGHDHHLSAQKSTVLPERQTSTRGRPQVTRIQTDLGGDIRAMATGNRRAPSPYSYTRSPTVLDSATPHKAAGDNFLSPGYALASPSPLNQTPRQAPVGSSQHLDRGASSATDNSSATSRYNHLQGQREDDQACKRILRNADPSVHVQTMPRLPRSKTANNVSHSYYDLPIPAPVDPALLSPPRSRRASKESTFGSSGEEKSSKYRSTYSKQSPRDSRDSPYTSSAEESLRAHRYRGEHSSSDEQRRLRRKSSHRRERPRFPEAENYHTTESVPPTAGGKSEFRSYRYDPRDRNQQQFPTPMAGNVNKAAVENYFVEAFRENERKRYNPNSTHSSGSTRVSPMASPPRTPRSERQSRDFFDLTPTIERPIQRSRPPSSEQIPSIDSKMHTTLLSAATAGAAGAAAASRIFESTARTSMPPPETNPSTSNKTLNPPRSARPSLVLPGESSLSMNAIPYSQVDVHHTTKASLSPTNAYDVRPVSRGSINGADYGYAHSPAHPHPYRALSYSGPDHSQSWNGSYHTSAVSPTHANAGCAPTHSQASIQPRSARTSVNGPDTLPSPRTNFTLPICPRPQPLVGHRDWYTIKEMSEIDICPTCVSAMATTRYQNLLVPSLPRPYNEPSLCAMSKPWVRIAFLQSLQQNKPNLNSIQALTSLPHDIKPCAGNKQDVKKWFQVIDPQTDEVIPDFVACSACVRAVDIVFPNIYEVFERKTRLNQERVCSLHTSSKHFHSIIDELEHMSVRCQGKKWRSTEILPLVKHLRRIARHRPCPRRELQASRAWHYMPELPEFTICEECYEEVVWPIHNRPLAQNITQSLSKIPVRRGSSDNSGTGCQLYSDRMRKIFREAVSSQNFDLLQIAVMHRLIAQQNFHAWNKVYYQDMKRGIDRRREIERNHEVWRGIE